MVIRNVSYLELLVQFTAVPVQHAQIQGSKVSIEAETQARETNVNNVSNSITITLQWRMVILHRPEYCKLTTTE